MIILLKFKIQWLVEDVSNKKISIIFKILYCICIVFINNIKGIEKIIKII